MSRNSIFFFLLISAKRLLVLQDPIKGTKGLIKARLFSVVAQSDSPLLVVEVSMPASSTVGTLNEDLKRDLSEEEVKEEKERVAEDRRIINNLRRYYHQVIHLIIILVGQVHLSPSRSKKNVQQKRNVDTP